MWSLGVSSLVWHLDLPLPLVKSLLILSLFELRVRVVWFLLGI
jgi:hypothetical protein